MPREACPGPGGDAAGARARADETLDTCLPRSTSGLDPTRSAGGRRVLEQIGEPLGPDRGLERPGDADVTGDEGEFALDRGREATGAIVHKGVEASHGSVEPFDGL